MLPDGPGTYVLILSLPCSQPVTVGRLGRFHFVAGWYAYVGSARGPGGLAARVARHLRPAKPLHWHIDYLRAQAQPKAVWFREGAMSLECVWAEALISQPEASTPIRYFGSSDCRCFSHLVHFAAQPSSSTIPGVHCVSVSDLLT